VRGCEKGELPVMFCDGVPHHAAVLKAGNAFFLRRASLPLHQAASALFLADKRFLNILETLVDLNLFRSGGILTICRIV